MKKIKIFLLSLASSIGALAADIDITPGQLEGLLGEAAKGQTELKLKGRIDARDLAALENLPSNIKTLDLSEVEIAPLTMPNRKYFGRTLFNQGEIPAYTFFKSGVTTLILPSDVSTICEGAFAGSDIEAIVIPEGITSLADYAFYGCPNLRSVSLPASLEKIGKGTFGNSMELVSLDLSSTKVSVIPERAFAGSVQLQALTLPREVTKVGREAFSHTSIRELDLSGVKEFEAYALSGMPMVTSLAINPEATIGDGLLMDNTSLASLTGMPEMVPAYFAANCGSLGAELASEAGAMGKYAFANTLAPEELQLNGPLYRIERGALSGLSSLCSIDVRTLDFIPEVDEFSFEGLDQPSILLKVSDDMESDWRNSDYWNLFNIMADSVVTGVDGIEAESGEGISVEARSGMLVIDSPALITDVRIYTTDGRVAFVASPDLNHLEIATDSLPSGVVIVAVSDEEGNSKTVSFILR